MNYLSHYIQDAQTKAFDEAGAFFAFSTEQFNDKKVEGVKYASLGAGLICPLENVKVLLERLDTIHREGVKRDLAENGKEAIIRREMGNYEVQYTGDLTDVKSKLEPYGITDEEIDSGYRKYYQECLDNDLF